MNDYQKAHYLIPYSWVLESIKITGMAKNAARFRRKSLASWNTQLQYLGDLLADVEIKIGTFQGDWVPFLIRNFTD